MSIETFAEQHQHSIAALGAFGTTAAAIIALYNGLLALRASRPRLKARVEIRQPIGGGAWLSGPRVQAKAGQPLYLVVDLKNVGSLPIELRPNCFFWRFPIDKSKGLLPPLDMKGDEHVRQRRYPYTLLPRTSETLFLQRMEDFHGQMAHFIQNRRLPLWLAVRCIRAFIFTGDGSLFRAKLDSSVRKALKTVQQVE